MRILIIMGCLALAISASAQEPTAAEKAMFIKVQDMGTYGFVFDKPSGHEDFNKTQFTEKSIEYDYTFKCDSCKQNLAIQQSVSIEANEKDADSTYQIEEQTIKELLGKWLTYKAYANYYPCGKKWEYKLLTSTANDKAVGFIYHYQKGRYTASLMIVGFDFDDPEMFKEFMEPLVKRTDDALAVLNK